MPAEYRIDTALGCVFSRAFGPLTDEELFQHQRQLAADPDFRPDLKQRWDFRGLSKVEVTSGAVRSLAKANQFGPTAQRAVITGSPVAHGLTRMFAAYGDLSAQHVQIFEDAAEANQWLGISFAEP